MQSLSQMHQIFVSWHWNLDSCLVAWPSNCCLASAAHQQQHLLRLLQCAASDHLERAALEHSHAAMCFQNTVSSCSSGTPPSCRTDISDRGLVTTVGVSSDHEVDIEIVGSTPQLTCRLFNATLVRMIDDSNKFLLNQIVRASARL